jgi:hypothetical protein
MFPPPLRGRAREGGRLTSGVQNRFENAYGICQNVRIPKTQNAITFGREPSVALNVSDRIGVLPAIELDDETMLLANEVDDKRPNRRLPSKAQAHQPMPA